MISAHAVEAEVIHTTADHPWLAADHGWMMAGTLHVGEPARLLDGGTVTVVALHTLPGVGAMWDLSLDSVHTFAVGAVQAIEHNCPPTDEASTGATPAKGNSGLRPTYGPKPKAPNPRDDMTTPEFGKLI